MADLALPRSFAGLMMQAQAIATMARVFGSDDPLPEGAPATSPSSTGPASTAGGPTSGSAGPVVTPGALATDPEDDATPPATVFTSEMMGPAPSAAGSLAGLRAPFTGPGDLPDGSSASSSDADPTGDTGSGQTNGTQGQSTRALPDGRAAALAGTAPAGAEMLLPTPAVSDASAADDGSAVPMPFESAAPLNAGGSETAAPLGIGPDGVEAGEGPGQGLSGAAAAIMQPTAPPAQAAVAEAAWPAGALPRDEHQSGSEAADRTRAEDHRADPAHSTDRPEGRDALALHDTTLRAEIAVSRRDQASSIDVWSSEVLRQIASSDAPIETGIIPSFILNAAMIPGWPPPRPFEMPTADGLIRLLMKQGPEAEEALLKNLAEHGGASLMTRLRKMLTRLSRSKRLKVLLGLSALMTTIEAAIEAIEAELLELSNLGAAEDDISFDDAFHRRHLSA